MAVITERIKTGSRKVYERYLSADAVAAEDEVDLSVLSGALTHCFIGVQMFNASGQQIVASSGFFTVTVRTLNTRLEEQIPDNVIDATAPTTIGVAGNIERVRVVPTGVTDVHIYRVLVTCNRP